MAKYADVTDVSVAMVTVEDSHLVTADTLVDGFLRSIGLTAAEIAGITLPNAPLKELAVTWGVMLAASAGAVGNDSFLTGTAKQYERMAKLLERGINREVLGLTVASTSGFGFISLGRG
jgi:hypothetical protein